MFLERLATIRDRIPGARALSLVAEDGLPVESVSGEDDGFDLEVLAAELLDQVRSISSQQRDLPLGDVEQFTVSTERVTLMVSSVGEGYYLLLVLDPHGSHGRARFELRRARLLLADDLY